MKVRNIALAIFLIAVCLAFGCAEHRVIVKGQTFANPLDVVSTNYTGYGWCEKCNPWERDWVSTKSPTNTIGYVAIRQSYWQAVVAVITFGARMPVTLEWRLNPVVEMED